MSELKNAILESIDAANHFLSNPNSRYNEDISSKEWYKNAITCQKNIAVLENNFRRVLNLLSEESRFVNNDVEAAKDAVLEDVIKEVLSK